MSFLVFDFDSTLVSVEGLDELFARSLDGAPDREARVAAFREITDLGMAGAISAEESLERRLGVLAADRGLVRTVGEEIREHISPSVARNLAFFRENLSRVGVVSGGFEELILPTLERMGLSPSGLHAHRFRYDESGRVLGLDPDTVIAKGGKPAAVERFREKERSVWMIGDGATDLEVRERGLADGFIAYTENRHRDPVVAKADFVAKSMDELIALLEKP
ncbi:MAG: HAD-IB family phosphatase [Gemmatimonadota bacterium]